MARSGLPVRPLTRRLAPAVLHVPPAPLIPNVSMVPAATAGARYAIDLNGATFAGRKGIMPPSSWPYTAIGDRTEIGEPAPSGPRET
jgi:hypothetical protein